MTDYDMAQAPQHFADLAKLTEAFFGHAMNQTQTVEDNLREEIRLMDEFNNRCFDLWLTKHQTEFVKTNNN